MAFLILSAWPLSTASPDPRGRPFSRGNRRGSVASQ